MFKVAVDNLGYYNEGQLRSQTIELPQEPEYIQAWLKDNGLIDSTHKEIFISDYVDGAPFGLDKVFGEFTPLWALNALAETMEKNNIAIDDPKMTSVCDALEITSIIYVINLVNNYSDIPFQPFDRELSLHATEDEVKKEFVFTYLRDTELESALEEAGLGLNALDPDYVFTTYTQDLLVTRSGFMPALSVREICSTYNSGEHIFDSQRITTDKEKEQPTPPTPQDPER